jgi:hypothetical protein
MQVVWPQFEHHRPNLPYVNRNWNRDLKHALINFKTHKTEYLIRRCKYFTCSRPVTAFIIIDVAVLLLK